MLVQVKFRYCDYRPRLSPFNVIKCRNTYIYRIPTYHVTITFACTICQKMESNSACYEYIFLLLLVHIVSILDQWLYILHYPSCFLIRKNCTPFSYVLFPYFVKNMKVNWHQYMNIST